MDSTNTPALPELEKDVVLSLQELKDHTDASLSMGLQIMAVRPLVANNTLVAIQEREKQLSEACKERDALRVSNHRLSRERDRLFSRRVVDSGAKVWLPYWRACKRWLKQLEQRAQKAEAELTEARTLLANQAPGMRRLIDLVRHQRGELFAEQLISAEELAALVADSESGQRVARLESYDAMREKIKSQAAEIATLREKETNGK